MHETQPPQPPRPPITDLIEQHLSHTIELRHHLHQHPELAFQEKHTSELIQRELNDIGIDFVAGMANGTGILAHVPATTDDGEAPGETISLRADMDALPIQEQSGLEYASENPGVMHACGHDGHTAILLGTARILSQLPHRPHPVTLLFQPAEEGGAGGKLMVEDGALDGSRIGLPVARIYALHGWPNVPLGTVATKVGPLLAATDDFTIHINGTGCHAAFPHLGRDPIIASAHVITALQTLVSRADPADSVVVSVTAVAGGDAYNILPSTVTLKGTVRTLLDETRASTKDRLYKIVEHVSSGMGCTTSIDWTAGYPVTNNHPDAVGRFFVVAKATIGETRVGVVEKPVMGGEDFAYYCDQIPACFFLLGLLDEEKDPARVPQLHQPAFNFNDKAIPVGLEMMVRLALEG